MTFDGHQREDQREQKRPAHRYQLIAQLLKTRNRSYHQTLPSPTVKVYHLRAHHHRQERRRTPQ